MIRWYKKDIYIIFKINTATINCLNYSQINVEHNEQLIHF
jgi:hypothetical protein